MNWKRADKKLPKAGKIVIVKYIDTPLTAGLTYMIPETYLFAIAKYEHETSTWRSYKCDLMHSIHDVVFWCEIEES
jgi:hypothetical protein